MVMDQMPMAQVALDYYGFGPSGDQPNFPCASLNIKIIQVLWKKWIMVYIYIIYWMHMWKYQSMKIITSFTFYLSSVWPHMGLTLFELSTLYGFSKNKTSPMVIQFLYFITNLDCQTKNLRHVHVKFNSAAVVNTTNSTNQGHFLLTSD